MTPQTLATCKAHLIVGLADITERGIPDDPEQKAAAEDECLAILKALRELAEIDPQMSFPQWMSEPENALEAYQVEGR